ncbi:MAG: hypothetical protein GX889_05605 [Clostridiales bacterium]|nr:hypothetical protein [Clostridiales bacterium]
MKCYICKTELIETKITIQDKEVSALKCPKCDDDYTTIIHAKDFISLKGKNMKGNYK